jgi:hypothetical protein
MLAVAGEIATEATEAIPVETMSVTVRPALPLFVPRLAIMEVVPALSPVTSPEAETVATVRSLELQLTLRFKTRLRESYKVAVACVVCPTLIEDCAMLTATAATGAR